MQITFVNVRHLAHARWMLLTSHCLPRLVQVELLCLKFEGRVALPGPLVRPLHDVPRDVDDLPVRSLGGVAVLGRREDYFVLK